MKTLVRSLLVALLGALVIVALTPVDVLRAQGQDAPAPATPPAASPPPPPDDKGAANKAPPADVELAPGDRISADNNVTFPTDI